MQPITISKISVLLYPYCGSADDNNGHELYNELEPETEFEWKDFIKKTIYMFYWEKYENRGLNEQYRIECKEALSYYLSNPGKALQWAWEGSLIAFDPPDYHQFFVWVWEVLFPGESWRMNDLSDNYEIK